MTVSGSTPDHACVARSAAEPEQNSAYRPAQVFVITACMKRSELTLNAIHLVIDYILLFAAALAAYSLRFGEAVAGFRPVVYEMPLKDYIVLALVFSAFVVIAFSWLGLYNLRSYRRMRKEISRVFLGCTAVFMFVIVLIFLERDLFSL